MSYQNLLLLSDIARDVKCSRERVKEKGRRGEERIIGQCACVAERGRAQPNASTETVATTGNMAPQLNRARG
jgi:hypothetical protein